MTYLILADGYTVTESFYNKVGSQVAEIIPAMLPGAKYTLEMLCGDEFWQSLSNGEKRLAGRCMAHSVASGQLSLSFARAKHEYPKWYELIQH